MNVLLHFGPAQAMPTFFLLPNRRSNLAGGNVDFAWNIVALDLYVILPASSSGR